MSTWNKKNFSIYTSDERSALGLIEELGSQTNYNTQELEKVKESDNKKVSHDEMNRIYKIDKNADFTGSWHGIKKPSASNEGLSALVDNINNNTIPNLQKEIEDIDNEKATKMEVDVERKRIDNLSSLGEGSTTGDAELIDGRVGIDGKVSKNIGSSIRNQISRIAYISPNRFNKNDVVKGYLNNEGVFVESEQFNLSNFIEFNTGEIVFTNIPNTIINYYNKDKVRLGSFNTPSDITQGVPLSEENISYIRIAFTNEQMINAYVGGIYDSNFPPYECKIKGEVEYESEIKDARKSIDEKEYNTIGDNIRESFKKIIKISPNKFNGNVSKGYYLDNKGLLIQNDLFNLSDYIEFNSGDTFYSNTRENIVNYYTKNKEWLGSFNTPRDITQGVPLSEENIAYIRIAFTNEQLMDAYVSNKYDSSFPQYGMTNILPLQLNENKKIFFDGDSITEGYYLEGTLYNYPMEVKKLLKCMVSNVAESGRGFCVKSQTKNKKTLYETISQSNYDDNRNNILYYACGVNDYLNNIPMGEKDSVDTSTFYGSVNNCIMTLQNKYPRSVKIFGLPLHYENENVPNEQGYILVDYVNALRERLEYYGIIYNDLWNNFGYNPCNEDVKKALFDVHGLHPYTIDGTKLLGERVTAFIKQIVVF